jgi:isopentenyl-diphosphate delta-isomerase
MVDRTVTACTKEGVPLSEVDIWTAHREGILHLAFSVFIQSLDGTKVLLQQRSPQKALFAGLWPNACCSHPFQGEDVVSAGERRLREELGFTVPLTQGPSFVYKAADPVSGLLEHEYDTVLFGVYDELLPIPFNTDEVADIRWVFVDTLREELYKVPEQFAPWLPQAFQIFLDR